MTQPAVCTPCSQGPDPILDVIDDYDGDDGGDPQPGLQPAERLPRKGRRELAKRSPSAY